MTLLETIVEDQAREDDHTEVSDILDTTMRSFVCLFLCDEEPSSFRDKNTELECQRHLPNSDNNDYIDRVFASDVVEALYQGEEDQVSRHVDMTQIAKPARSEASLDTHAVSTKQEEKEEFGEVMEVHDDDDDDANNRSVSSQEDSLATASTSDDDLSNEEPRAQDPEETPLIYPSSTSKTILPATQSSWLSTINTTTVPSVFLILFCWIVWTRVVIRFQAALLSPSSVIYLPPSTTTTDSQAKMCPAPEWPSVLHDNDETNLGSRLVDFDLNDLTAEPPVIKNEKHATVYNYHLAGISPLLVYRH